MRLLFVDTVTAKPYLVRSVEEAAIGGSESTLARIAGALAADFDVTVAQSARRDAESDAGVQFIPLDGIDDAAFPSPDAIVVLRKARPVARLRERFPAARLILWLHNFVKPEFLRFVPGLVRADCTLVCVSCHHQEQTAALLHGGLLGLTAGRVLGASSLLPCHVHNPIADELEPDARPVERNKLVFLSSPHKGLDQVLAAFRQARQRMPDLELHVANPGYHAGLEQGDGRAELAREGIEVLGPLPHRAAMEQIRDALCLFYPQTVFPETFGIIYAEANALGVPVLGHPMGAAREVLAETNPLIDCTRTEDVVATLARWYSGERPTVQAREEFRLSRIAEQWSALLQSPRGA